jgi:hypothetical protein
VRLSADSPPGDVALVVAQLASYGGDRSSFAELLEAFPGVLPGGLAAVHDGLVIPPSCCCGLEGWRDWEALLEDGTSPWLGHDPSPWVELVDDSFVVWADQRDATRPPTARVLFTPHQLRAALLRANDDVSAFVSTLRAWLAERDPGRAGAIADKFYETFVAQGRQPG